MNTESTTDLSLLLQQARSAQQQLENYNQTQVDELVTAMAWTLVKPENNKSLSELAVATTGFGKVEDNIIKNQRKTIGLLADLQEAKSVGVINEIPERGLIEIARPVGVVAAIIPSTNPVTTCVNKAMNAIKGRNAIIFAPSPKAQQSCSRLIELMQIDLQRLNAPPYLVQHLPAPVKRAQTQALMQMADLVVATGSQKNIRAAYASGTPTFGVGRGNVVVIIDEDADLADAAEKIAKSKAFDYGTSCSSENNLVILARVFNEMLATLGAAGGALLTAEEKLKLQACLWPQGLLNANALAQSPAKLCQMAGLQRSELVHARFLMVAEDGVGPDYPFSGEKLTPVLTIYRQENFSGAFALTKRILDYQGIGHSCGIYSSNQQHILQLGLELPVARVIVNQAHCFATGGSFDNGLAFSLSMGCGTWAGNNFSDNLNYRHFLNITRIAFRICRQEPTQDELFGAYRQKYGL